MISSSFTFYRLRCHFCLPYSPRPLSVQVLRQQQLRRLGQERLDPLPGGQQPSGARQLLQDPHRAVRPQGPPVQHIQGGGERVERGTGGASVGISVTSEAKGGRAAALPPQLMQHSKGKQKHTDTFCLSFREAASPSWRNSSWTT